MSNQEVTSSAEPATSSVVRFSQVRSAPALKYLGIATLLAWHYCLWFVPQVFPHANLLSSTITISWLIDLGSSVFFFFLIPLLLGRKKHLSQQRWLFWAAPAFATIGTLCFTLAPITFAFPLVAYLIAGGLGCSGAILWMLWGEHYACVKANFSINHIGPVVGLTLLISLLLVSFLPMPIPSLLVSAMPLAAGLLLLKAVKPDRNTSFPPLLPKSTTEKGLKSIVIVCSISFVASAACYFLVAIIPWDELPTQVDSFAFGAIGGALLMLAISAICIASRHKYNIFKMFPWLLVCLVIAYALFLADEALYLPAFLLAVAISSVFEVLLAMYFGILTSKGYAVPALAFGFSGGFIRAGIAMGNILAIAYESNPDFAAAFTPETALAFLCILMAILIPLVRQEYTINSLTSDPLSESDLDRICAETAEEFSLSGREAEILTLIARGHTAESIAKKLVISPYTVNTHIRHTYDKMEIHKRSELLNYLNMQRSNF